MHHLALRTRDLAALEHFYIAIAGLALVKRDGERSTWLRSGGVIVMIERAGDGEPPPTAGSLDLLAFPVADLVVAEAACARAGVPVEARTSYTLYIRDPDGRRVGLSIYRFDVL